MADVQRFAKSLMYIGIEKFQGVGIIGFNSPEWVIGNVGAIFAGCIPAGIYSTNGPEACHYVADHCNAAVLLVEDETQLEKVLEIRDRLPNLKAIVQWQGTVRTDIPDLHSWDNFLKLGSSVSSESLVLRTKDIKPGHCCMLIYTSGTTGNPKAVMLSHDNITWTSRLGMNILFNGVDGVETPQRMVSYLPLSHVAAQITDIHGPMSLGTTIYFAKPDALKGSLVQTLVAAKPTLFLGVPRVWEKIEEKMRAIGALNSGVKKSIGEWAKQIGLEASQAKLIGQTAPWGWNIANLMVFSNIKKSLGLDQCALNFTGAAPIATKTLEYFMSLDIPIYEIYGMSETTGPHTVNHKGACKMGTVGQVMNGVENKLSNPDTKGNGEICMRGRHVFMGYLHNEEATTSTIDAQGWLHSGDIGRVDQDGYLCITGRIKELIITAGGENVPPVLIEDVIKEELPIISNVMVIGDQRKYLSCLLTLKSEPNSDGAPSTIPFSTTMSVLSEIGSTATSIPTAASCPKLKAYIQEGINRANTRAISRAQHVRKFAILPSDFTVETGELTPTMKLKRAIVEKMHATTICELYPDTKQLQSRL